MRCDIVIPVYDQLEYTKECVDSILKYTRFPHRVIIVDDSSKKETADYLDSLAAAGKVILLRNSSNLGWVGTVNKGLKSTDAEYVCVMNNDTRVYPGWLDEMVRIAESDAQIGLVNPSWHLPGVCRMSPDDYFKKVIVKRQGEYIETDWVRGFCFLIKRKVIEKIGGLDDLFAPAYYDDWDYSVRAINAGFTCVRAEGAFVCHYGNITYEHMFGRTKLNRTLCEKKEVFEKKWGRPLYVALFIDGIMGKDRDAICIFALSLLRDQNRLDVIDGVGCFNVRHTNCRINKVLGWFAVILVLFALLSNLRYRKERRYDAILCSDQLRRFLTIFPVLRNNFIILAIDSTDEQSLRNIMDTIKGLKFQFR